MRHNRSILSPLALLLLLSLFVSLVPGCSAAPAPSSPSVQSGAPASGQANVASSSKATGGQADSAPRAPVPPAQSSGGSAPSASSSAPASGAAGSTTGAAASWDRVIIRNANLSIVVKNVEDSLGQIRQITDASQGFTASAQTSYKGDY